MEILTVLFVTSLLFLIGAATFDFTETERGLAAKVALEGNTWMTGLFGPTPSLLDYFSVDFAIWACLSVPAIFGWVVLWPLGLYLSIGTFIGYGVKHLQGGFAWKALLKTK